MTLHFRARSSQWSKYSRMAPSSAPSTFTEIFPDPGRKTPRTQKPAEILGFQRVSIERRGWDLNPRSPCEDTSLAGRHNRPYSVTSPITLG